MKRLTKTCLAAVIAAASIGFGAAVYAADFSDVPSDHWAYAEISQMQSLGIAGGLDEGYFGASAPMTRAQLAAYLCGLNGWEATGTQAFSDVAPGDWYYGFIGAAAKNGVFLEQSGSFRPDAPITRAEMAVMLVRSLGMGELAEQISESGFSDVQAHAGYVALARDFGIIHGLDDTRFAPNEAATRAHGAVMLMRMHNRRNANTAFLNGFYAIRSAGQMDYVPQLDSVCYGWSRFEMDGRLTLNMTTGGGNEYGMPDGYERPLGMAKSALLMVAVKDAYTNGISLTDQIISSANLRADAVDAIVSALDKYPQFAGVAIDFEGMKGEQLKSGFTAFLTSLRARLPGKLLYVAVHPKPRPGQVYFDAYDYAAIGTLADKVILMAHDYHAKRMTPQEMEMNLTVTPLAPIEQVYHSLKAITDAKTGVKDKSKILLQFSFDTAQWQSSGGKIINAAAFTPTYDQLMARIQTSGGVNYSPRYQSPYVTYTADDGTQNTIWYEDARSVSAKMTLAKLFGINGFSLWRLGTVPAYDPGLNMDVWSAVRVGRRMVP